jgi:hypothetical protein
VCAKKFEGRTYYALKKCVHTQQAPKSKNAQKFLSVEKTQEHQILKKSFLPLTK